MAYIASNASLAAWTVLSTTSSVCAVEKNAASNWEGARYTPPPSMAVKKRPKRAVSLALALGQSRTGVSLKKVQNIVPTRVW